MNIVSYTKPCPMLSFKRLKSRPKVSYFLEGSVWAYVSICWVLMLRCVLRNDGLLDSISSILAECWHCWRESLFGFVLHLFWWIYSCAGGSGYGAYWRIRKPLLSTLCLSFEFNFRWADLRLRCQKLSYLVWYNLMRLLGYRMHTESLTGEGSLGWIDP